MRFTGIRIRRRILCTLWAGAAVFALAAWLAGAPAAARLPGPLVDPGWLAAHLGEAGLRVVDVRLSSDAYRQAHIPGSLYVNPLTDLVDPDHPVQGMALPRAAFEGLMNRLGIAREDTVVLYDGDRSLWAARAYWVFKLYGHPRVAILDGGIALWQGQRRPIEQGDGSKQAAPASAAAAGHGSGYRASGPDPALVATWEDVKRAMDEGAVCDVRSAREYAGLDVRALRGGHVPGALNVEWVLATRADGTFKPVEQLRDLYRRAGILPDPGREVIVYCQTGVRAAHTWFVLKELLGYPAVRVYDGSWAEWGNRDDLPVER